MGTNHQYGTVVVAYKGPDEDPSLKRSTPEFYGTVPTKLYLIVLLHKGYLGTIQSS
jgi:hypothetical protein